jgi:hypothetical protein
LFQWIEFGHKIEEKTNLTYWKVKEVGSFQKLVWMLALALGKELVSESVMVWE